MLEERFLIISTILIFLSMTMRLLNGTKVHVLKFLDISVGLELLIYIFMEV